MSRDQENDRSLGSAGVIDGGTHERKLKQHEKSTAVEGRDLQTDAREGQAVPPGMAERPVVAMKPGNAGGAKGPQFQRKRKKE